MGKKIASCLKSKFGSAKFELATAVATAAAVTSGTFCGPTSTGITALDSLATLIQNIMKWAGWILLAVGAAMVIKAIINSTSGQGQPGEIGKALGMAAGGAALLVIDVVMGLLGG